MKNFTQLFIFLTFFLVSVSLYSQTTYYVDASKTDNTGVGTSWATAKKDLQPAIDLAIAGDEIRVATGTYLPTENPDGSATTATNRNNAFHLNTDISIKGSYNPSTDTQDYNNPSILSGDFSGNDVITGTGTTLNIANNTENAYHAFITTNLSNAAVLDGFTLQGGNADNGSATITYNSESFRKSDGGGLYNIKSSPTLTNNTFLGNSCRDRGAGMFNFISSSPIINNATFSNNVAERGGGINNNGNANLTTASSPIISNSTFSGNLAESGGGMFNEYSLPSISNTSFSNNATNNGNGLGGGMFNISSSPTISNVQFTNNASISQGGGIHNEFSSSPNISNTTFSGNTATKEGGGISNTLSSSPTITNCVFDNNSANGNAFFGVKGGGMSNATGSSPIITNTVFSNNTSNNSASTILGGGGGLSNFNNCLPTLTNVTFFGNTTNVNGGGIYNDRNSITTLNNTVLYNNVSDIQNNDGSSITGANNYAENFVQTGFTALAANPFTNSADLDGADNIFATTDDGLIPAIGSVLINAGNNSVNSILTDLTGETRIKNTTIDIGAYEFDSTFSNWTGTVNTVWSNAGNWSNGIPTATTTSIIASAIANQPLVSSANNSIKKLTITAGASIAIAATGSLTATESVTNDGVFTITSDASNNGSFILEGTYAGTSNVTYQRYVSDDWHLLSSPVNNQNINGFKNLVATNANRFAIASYNNNLASNRYVYYTDNTGAYDIDAADAFVKGQGYSVRKLVAGTFDFSGILHTDDVPVTISDNSATVGNKWNLVGNPFTSLIALNVDADATNNFLTVNASKLDPARVAIYQWNATNNSYDIINLATGSAKYAAPGQGFFVEAIDGGETINFTEAIQKHNTGNIFSKNANTKRELLISIQESGISKLTQIKYIEGTTQDLDLGFDAGVFSGDSYGFNVYTHLVSNDKGVDFALQCLPNQNLETMIIPLGINASVDKTITISAESLNLLEGLSVYLEDKETAAFIDLTNKDYEFTTSENINGVGRFFIHTKSKTLHTDTTALIENIHIYQTSKNNLNIDGIEKGISKIRIYNILGKQILTSSFIANGKNDIALPNIKKGIYLVEVITEKGKMNTKLLLK